MKLSPWTYLAIIAVSIFWNLPGIILWGLCAVMAVDLIRGTVSLIRGTSDRLRCSLHDPLDEPIPTLIEGPNGERWQISTDGKWSPRCAHHDAVEVRRLAVPAVGVTDDLVAWWCPDCKTQLPAGWVRDGQMSGDPEGRAWRTAADAERAKIAAHYRQMAAFQRGQKSRAPVWVDSDSSSAASGQIVVERELPSSFPPAPAPPIEIRTVPLPGRLPEGVTRKGTGYSFHGRYYQALEALTVSRHVCDPSRCRTAQQVEAQTGRHAVEVTGIGDPHRRYLAGAPIACSHCGSRSLSPVAPIFCLDCGRGV